MTTPAPAAPPTLRWYSRVLLFLIGALIALGAGWAFKQELGSNVIQGAHTVHLGIFGGIGVVGLIVLLASIPGALPVVEQGIASFGAATGSALKNAPLPWHRDGGGS